LDPRAYGVRVPRVDGRAPPETEVDPTPIRVTVLLKFIAFINRPEANTPFREIS
jgi:hypothetical protein